MSIRFLTHAEVVIDPDVPVPDWPLSDVGRARHSTHAEALRDAGADVAEIWSSAEQKALDAAGILADALRAQVRVDPELGENDRSATGFLPKDEFEATADRFFAEPDVSVRGWERAVDAQARIWRALERIDCDNRERLVVAHGGVGALAMARALGQPISRDFDQPGHGGGAEFLLETMPPRMIRGWRLI